MQRRAVVALAAVGLVGIALLVGVAAGPLGVLESPSGTGPADGASGGPARGTTDGDSAVDRPTESQTEDDIVETVEYRLLPEEPGRVEATITYAVPENVESLRFRIVGGSYRVASTDGFERVDGAFEWDGRGAGGSVTVTHDVAESFRREAGDEQYVGGTGEWAIVARPQTNTNFTYFAPRPDVEYRLRVDGRGRAGERLAYLGPYTEYARTVDGERLALVVPDAAEPASEPEAILESLRYASDRLRIGNRNEEVVVIAAPAGAVDWGPPGLSIGSDARVAADTPVDEPVNVWIHEYVHTRQYRDSARAGEAAVARNARWLIEGSADYYGALYNLELGHTDFATFRRVLERGTDARVADSVLADPATWGEDAAYEKGALVAATIDLRIRRASGGDATLQQVLAEWNRQATFDAEDLEAAVESYANASVRSFVETHTRTEATPEPWGRDAHARYFDAEIAQFDYDAGDDPAFRLAGPHREGDLPEVVVPGETVAATVTVENVGEVEGPYRAVLVADGETVAAREGRLAPGATATVVLNHTVGATGELTLRAGDASRTVTVAEPAEPVVAELTARPDRPMPDESVDVAVTVRNPADRPAAGAVGVHAGGVGVANESVWLAPNTTTTVEVSTSFADPGDREITAGDLAVTVAVQEAGPLDRLPGFGAAPALAALALALGLRSRRE